MNSRSYIDSWELKQKEFLEQIFIISLSEMYQGTVFKTIAPKMFYEGEADFLGKSRIDGLNIFRYKNK